MKSIKVLAVKSHILERLKMEKYTSGLELPVGLGLALEQYNAMDYFFSLPAEAQHHIVDHTHTIQSKNEMLDFVIYGLE